VASERAAVYDSERKLRAREEAVRDKEERVRRRLDAKVDDRLRDARREIDVVIEDLKAKAAALSEQAAVRLKSGERLRAAGLNTGDMGTLKAEARAALDTIARRIKDTETPPGVPMPGEPGEIGVGARVVVGALGLEGVVLELHGSQADVDVRGKRLRAAVGELRMIKGGAPPARVNVSVDLQPRQGSLTELNIIGSTVDDALARLEKFLDESTMSDVREIRIVHGHGTGQLRRAVGEFLENHPLVERHETAPPNQGGGGATIAYLRD
jgi:DNA mismatch repair protein MutS2